MMCDMADTIYNWAMAGLAVACAGGMLCLVVWAWRALLREPKL